MAKALGFLLIALMAPAALLWHQAWADSIDSGLGRLKVERIAGGLREPWGLAFLPGGGFLVTLKGGRLRHYSPDGRHVDVDGVPNVSALGQGGLLDVALARDFSGSRLLYLSYSTKESGGSRTALASARLSKDGSGLEGLKVIFQMSGKSYTSRHFGSRIVNVDDRYLFLTIGDRGDRPEAQSLSSHNGTVLRIRADGSVPSGNPFAGGGRLPEIWSYGHRNAQGAALDSDGQLWIVEHGARGGDEINRIVKGQNYGWPVISYGTHYSGSKIGEGTHKEGMLQPDFYWDPSIAPSGMMIHSGKMFPEWKGDMFIGSLKFHHIERIDRSGNTLSEGERLSSPETRRVRDVREAPDGSIWFLSVGRGAVYRIYR